LVDLSSDGFVILDDNSLMPPRQTLGVPIAKAPTNVGYRCGRDRNSSDKA